MARWMKAQDTFTALLADGSQRFVTKGDVMPESHELVQRDLSDQDPGRIRLFRPLDDGEEEAASATPKSASAAAPAKPGKAAGKASP